MGGLLGLTGVAADFYLSIVMHETVSPCKSIMTRHRHHPHLQRGVNPSLGGGTATGTRDGHPRGDHEVTDGGDDVAVGLRVERQLGWLKQLSD